MGDPELAFTTVQEAIALDPFNPSAQQPFDAIDGAIPSRIPGTAARAC
jgi:hypothetical protein